MKDSSGCSYSPRLDYQSLFEQGASAPPPKAGVGTRDRAYYFPSGEKELSCEFCADSGDSESEEKSDYDLESRKPTQCNGTFPS